MKRKKGFDNSNTFNAVSKSRKTPGFAEKNYHQLQLIYQASPIFMKTFLRFTYKNSGGEKYYVSGDLRSFYKLKNVYWEYRLNKLLKASCDSPWPFR